MRTVGYMMMLGGIFILLAIYFFPFGQDLVMLQLTEWTGSQVAAWNLMYYICFGLLAAGYILGGHRFLGFRKLGRFFGLIRSNPVLFIIFLIAMYVIFIAVSGRFA